MHRIVDDLTRAGSNARAAFVAAVRSGDATAASELYTRDARLLAPSSPPIRGRHAIEQYWQTGVSAGMCDVELELVTIETRGSIAYELGRYAVRVDDGGAMVVDRGDYLLVHERQEDGSWRWAVEMFNPDAPGARSSEGRKS
jgi:ketosteroid isomerase-like protein